MSSTGIAVTSQEQVGDLHIGISNPFFNYTYTKDQAVTCGFHGEGTAITVQGVVIGQASSSIPYLGIGWIVQFSVEDAKRVTGARKQHAANLLSGSNCMQRFTLDADTQP